MKNNQRFDYSALAEILGQRGLVEPERLAVALQTCAQSGFPFPELLVDNGLITDWEIARVVCELYGLPFLPVESYSPNSAAGEGLDLEFLHMNKIIPMERNGSLLTVCMPVLVPAEVLGILSAQTGLKILPIVGTVTGNRAWLLEQASTQKATPPRAKAKAPEAAQVPAAAESESLQLETEVEEELELDAASLEEWSNLFDEADAAVHIALDVDDEPEEALAEDERPGSEA